MQLQPVRLHLAGLDPGLGLAWHLLQHLLENGRLQQAALLGLVLCGGRLGIQRNVANTATIVVAGPGFGLESC